MSLCWQETDREINCDHESTRDFCTNLGRVGSQDSQPPPPVWVSKGQMLQGQGRVSPPPKAPPLFQLDSPFVSFYKSIIYFTKHPKLKPAARILSFVRSFVRSGSKMADATSCPHLTTMRLLPVCRAAPLCLGSSHCGRRFPSHG